jgi:DNA-binding NarL/FixJ family response regulator
VIRVLIADDHGVVREGLARLLPTAGDLEVAATAADGEEAVALYEEHRPDVVLMDISMPGVDGTEATRRILAANPEAAIVILTSFSDREQILAALDAGAIGYLLKDVEPDELVRAVAAAARGESPLAPKAATAVLAARAPAPADELTQREREILELVAAGCRTRRSRAGSGSATRPCARRASVG